MISHVYPHVSVMVTCSISSQKKDPKLSPRGICSKSLRTCSPWPAALSIALKLTRS